MPLPNPPGHSAATSAPCRNIEKLNLVGIEDVGAAAVRAQYDAAVTGTYPECIKLQWVQPAGEPAAVVVCGHDLLTTGPGGVGVCAYRRKVGNGVRGYWGKLGIRGRQGAAVRAKRPWQTIIVIGVIDLDLNGGVTCPFVVAVRVTG